MIHKFYMNGHYIVLDVNSGAIHEVDELTYRLLDAYDRADFEEAFQILGENYGKEEAADALGEIEELKSQGLLFSEDTYEGLPDIAAGREPVVKALCLLVAHDCNLRCEYCFAGEGEYGSYGRRLMSPETGKKAIDFLIAHSGSRRNLEVDFFGGEPLMNMETVKAVVDYARSLEKEYNKNFRFTITTNGLLLNEGNMDYINENMSNVVLSLDGRESVNDRVRKTKGGRGSYSLIMPRFQEMAEKRGHKNYYIRGTFTAYNKDFAQDALHLADVGFKQVSVEPVVGDARLPYALKEEDLEDLCREYEALAKAMLDRKRQGQDFNFFHFMLDFTGGPCVAKRLAGCGAGAEYLSVTAEGDLYPCHQFTGIEEFKMGNVENGVEKDDLRNRFEKENVYSKEECRSCWAKFYCSGGCAANAYHANGELSKPYGLGCVLQRKRTECAIMMNVDGIN